MAGSPGGTEEGRASIRVVPDTSRFAADLRGQLEKLRRELALNIPVELDTTGLAEKAKAAVAEANAAAGKVHIKADVDKPTLAKAANTLRSFAGDVGRGVTTALKFASFAGLGLSALNAVPAVLSLAGSLTSLVGVIGLMPAGIAGAVAGIGTLALGFNGFGEALKNIGDPAKFAEAIKGLSPAARSAALAIKALAPQFHALQQSIQDVLFSNLDRDIKNTATAVLPVLRRELTLIANGFNSIFHEAAGAFQIIAKNGTLGTTLHNIGRSLNLFAPAISSLIQAFSQVAAVGSSFLPGFAQSISDATAAFAGFVNQAAKSGALHDFIQGALDAFGQLFSVVQGVARIIGGLVVAAQAAGGGTLATLATLLQHIADVVNGPAFQQGLTTVFQGIQAGANELATALPAIASALVALAPAIGTFAGQLGVVLAAALQTLAPLLVTLGPSLNALFAALGPALTAGLNAIVPAIVQILSAIGPDLLNGVTIIITKIGDAFVALSPILATFADTLTSNKPLLIGLGIIAAALVGPFTTLAVIAALVATNFGTLSAFFTNNVLPVLVQVQTFLQPVIDALIELGTTVVGAGVRLLPVIQQIAAVFVTQWPAIQQTVVSVMTSVRDVVVAVIQIISQVIKAAVAVILFLWNAFGGTILATVNRVFPAIAQIIRGVFNIIAGIFQAVSALLRGDWSGLWSALGRIAKGGIDVVVGLIKGIGGLILGALGLIKDAALTLGKAIIDGIIAGVKGGVGAIKDAVVGAAKGALDSAKSFLHINSPSLVFSKEVGMPISEGIAHGVAKGAPMIGAAITDAVATPNLTALDGGGGAGRGVGGIGVNIENVTVKDVDAMAEAITTEQRDAAVVENLQLALVGAA